MPYSRWRRPDVPVTSSNCPLPLFRYRRCRARLARAGSVREPPSTRKRSSQPSSSKSKNTAPDPIVSTMCFCALAPLTGWKFRPACRVMSVNVTLALWAEGVRGAAPREASTSRTHEAIARAGQSPDGAPRERAALTASYAVRWARLGSSCPRRTLRPDIAERRSPRGRGHSSAAEWPLRTSPAFTRSAPAARGSDPSGGA